MVLVKKLFKFFDGAVVVPNDLVEGFNIALVEIRESGGVGVAWSDPTFPVFVRQGIGAGVAGGTDGCCFLCGRILKKQCHGQRFVRPCRAH